MTAIALVTIARNEERSIGRLLESVKPFVDEMIVVDTGSTDHTIEIARSVGAKISHFHWTNDFSEARNYSLTRTRAPWRLILDADEWLDSTESDFNAIRESAPTFVGRINRSDRFHGDIAGRRQVLTSQTNISRLIPAGVIYTGRIHEQLQHQLPVRAVPVSVWHDGYEDEQLARKGDRNFSILEDMVTTERFDGYYRYQYAKELMRKNRYLEACQHLESALNSTSVMTPWRESLACTALNAFGTAKKFDRGLELVEAECAHYVDSPDFWFSVGCFYMDVVQARPKFGARLLSLIERSFLRCLELGERPERTIDEKVAGRGSFLAAQNLYAFYVATNQPTKADSIEHLRSEK